MPRTDIPNISKIVTLILFEKKSENFVIAVSFIDMKL
jgi:hypothetical protein